MRALPADSLEYFGNTAVGNTALDGTAGFAGAASFVGSVVFLVSVVVEALAAGSVAVGAAPAAHSVLRKSFHDLPPSVPAALAV